jgi:hypothetical protein
MLEIITAAALLLSWGPTAWCGPAAGELTLDRAAVRDLIALALPDPLQVDLRGLGSVSLRIDAPAEVRFHEGGVETSLALRVSRLDDPLELRVRYVPAIEPLTGTVRLEPESIVPVISLPFDFDLAGWLEPIALPRRLDWNLELGPGKSTRVTCFIQGLAVEAERLRIDLGLVGNGSTPNR